MAVTTIRINDPQAVRRWATGLAVGVRSKQYWDKFTGEGENNIIQIRTDLEKQAGDRVQFDLSAPLSGDMVMGDDRAAGTEENLTFYEDEVRLDQARKVTDSGGRMTKKRTIHDLRQVAKDRTEDYVAEWLDDQYFVHLSGDSTFAATNVDCKVRNAAQAINPVLAPDAGHQLYGGAAKAKAELTIADTMSMRTIQRTALYPAMIGQKSTDLYRMNGVVSEGGAGKRFVLVMSPLQAFAMKTEAGETGWASAIRAMTTAVGRDSPMFTGALGMLDGVILHQHEKVRLFNGYGAGANVRAARALLLGRQAGVACYGGAGGKRKFQWIEEATDLRNRLSIAAGIIFGVKKVRYNGNDFGVVAIDTAVADPN